MFYTGRANGMGLIYLTHPDAISVESLQIFGLDSEFSSVVSDTATLLDVGVKVDTDSPNDDETN